MSDFGESKRVMSFQQRRCDYCYGPIPEREKHWSWKGRFDGEWQSWRMHDECMTDYSDHGDGEFFPGDAPWPKRIAEIWSAI